MWRHTHQLAMIHFDKTVLMLLVLTACGAPSGKASDRNAYGGNGGSAAGDGGSHAGFPGGGNAGTNASGAAGSSAPGSGGAVGSGGAAGSGGVAGSGGIGASAGSAGQGAGAVTFDWPETTPGTGTCKAGHYKGDFVGIFASSMTVFPAPIPVAGNVELTLEESANGEFLEVTGGKVSGVADLLFPYAADVVGRLNCATRKLEGGFLKNGNYLVGIFVLPFEGPLNADYDTLTMSFVNGTWDVKEPNPIYGGLGTWTAKSVP